MTFWEHLDELRGCLIRSLVAVLAAAVVAFCFKDFVFGLLLAPCNSDFFTYRLLGSVAEGFLASDIELFNPELTRQFMVHLQVSLWAGLLVVAPYVLYLLFHFVAPALYQNEKRYVVASVGGGYLMFLLGMALNYCVVFPLTLRFLASYQVSESVGNIISLQSYISTFLTLGLLLGVAFELPILCWLLAKFGLLRAEVMRKGRRYAVVVILLVAALITPTGDALTLLLVAVPVILLYEVSIWIVARNARVSQHTAA